MAITAFWPAELPPTLPIDGLEVTPQDGRLSFSPDTGADITINIFSEEPIVYEVSRHVWTDSQWETFETFWRVTLAGRGGPFIWGAPPEGLAEDPLGPGTGHKTLKFVNRPTYRPITSPMILPEDAGFGAQRRLQVSYSLIEFPYYEEAE